MVKSEGYYSYLSAFYGSSPLKDSHASVNKVQLLQSAIGYDLLGSGFCLECKT